MPARFDYLKFQFKTFCPPVKTNCPSAENFHETPGAFFFEERELVVQYPTLLSRANFISGMVNSFLFLTILRIGRSLFCPIIENQKLRENVNFKYVESVLIIRCMDLH